MSISPLPTYASRPTTASTSTSGRSPRAPSRGHVLCDGNGGNVGDRVDHARLLSTAGYDVLADYRGYGEKWPAKRGWFYRDARAAGRALLDQDP